MKRWDPLPMGGAAMAKKSREMKRAAMENPIIQLVPVRFFVACYGAI